MCLCVQPVICTCVGSEAPPSLELRLTYTRYLSTASLSPCMQSILSVLFHFHLPYLTPSLPLTSLYFSFFQFHFLLSSPPFSTSLVQNKTSIFSLLHFSFPSSLPSHCSSSILLNPSPQAPVAYPYDCSHIAMTYTALASLLILGDDLSRVNRPGVFRGMRELQLDSGR